MRDDRQRAAPLQSPLPATRYPLLTLGAGSEGARYAGADTKLYEVALFDVSAAVIRKIAQTKAVGVSLQGDFHLEKSFNNVNTLYFRQFVQHYIEKTPTADK